MTRSNLKTITSRQNQEIIEVAALANAKARSQQKKFIAEGTRTVATLIASPLKLVQLYVTQELLETAYGLTPEKNITLVHNSVMEKLSHASSPSGILGVFQIPEHPKPDQLTPGLVLARIADPGNMGTLMRTCAALNIKSVVIIEGTDPWSPKVVQSSAGTIGNLNIFRWSWDELVKNKGAHAVCALVVTGGKNPKELDTKKSLIVVGSEAEGIPQAWLAECEQQMTLPMPGGTESLNAAIAGSIALYLSQA